MISRGLWPGRGLVRLWPGELSAAGLSGAFLGFRSGQSSQKTRDEMTPSDYKNAWVKYIRDPDNQPEIPGITRWSLIGYCLLLAEYGNCGRNCHPKRATIARDLGCARMPTISQYHQIAMQLEWFVPNGKHSGRIKHVDINIPGVPRD